MRNRITFSFHYVTFAKPCFEFQKTERVISLDIKNILTISQVDFNFTYVLFIICGNHFCRLILLFLLLTPKY